MTAGKRRSLKIVGGVAAVVLIGLVVVWLDVGRGSDEPTASLATFVAKKGPLTISVLESGTIKAREQIIIKNEVEGKTSIITLVPEGTQVKKGQLLVELDASTLKDAKIDQEILVEKTGAAYTNAIENLAVVQNQAKSDTDKAELTLTFAKQDLYQYEKGQFPNLEKAAMSNITLAQEELTRALDTLNWSKTLYEEKYIAKTQFQADDLAWKRADLTLQLRRNELDLLQQYTYKRNMAQYTSDVNQATMALERTVRKARADVAQAEADLKAKDAEYQRQQDKLARLTSQLGKTRIVAPADGLVVYATSARTGGAFRGGQQPLEEGQTVFERQELIYLPTTESSMAEVDIHESSLEKVRVGLPVVITVEALAGKKFLGRMAAIAPLPDARSMWMNPDLKVYNSKVYLDENDSALRTGMSCKAEIIVEQYDDVVYIPVGAVMRVGGEPTVHVVKGKSIEPRKVEIGLDNNRMIRIVSGIQEGEVVSLTPPLKSAAIDLMSEKADVNASRIPGGSETMREKINRRLEEANAPTQDSQDSPPPARADRPRGGARPSEAIGREERAPEQQDREIGASGPPSEEREKMRQRFENMSPEEREKEVEKMKQRLQNMSPEEREKMRQGRMKRQQGNRGNTDE